MTDNTSNENNDTTIDNTGNDEDKSFWDKYKYRIILLFFIILLAYTAFGVIPYTAFCEWDKRGQFGDMFGAGNALFSGFALAGVIIAIILQSQELKAQREELQLTREEMKLTRKEVEEQTSLMSSQIDLNKQQQWENTFFKMLELLRSLSNQFSWSDKRGQDAFELVSKSFIFYQKSDFDLDAEKASFDHYINTIIGILKYILENEDESLQLKYLHLFKSQISISEAHLISLYNDHFNQLSELSVLIKKTNFLDLFDLDEYLGA